MCIAYLFFYRPRTYGSLLLDLCGYNLGFAPCQDNHTKDALNLTSELGRVFGAPDENCNDNSSGTEAPSAAPSAATIRGNQSALVTSGAVCNSLFTAFCLMTTAFVGIAIM
jgi:hypothetical protein